MLARQLSPVERLILCSSWQGQSYSEMAKDCAYSICYLKEAGSQLWREFSETLGEKVTKKNLQLVVNQYRQNYTEQHTAQPHQINVETRSGPTPVLTRAKIKFPGGSLPLDSPLYINRSQIEELAYAKIRQPRCLLRISAPKQMGKSSLLNRILAHGQAIGYKTVYLNFQEADSVIFADLDKFLRWFCTNISKRLNLNPMLDDYWDEDMGSKVSCKIYFQSYLLKRIDSPVVLALDELDRVLTHHSIAADFLQMLRAWHEWTPQVETWQKLRIVLVYSTDIFIPLKIYLPALDIGLFINLPHFTLEQVQELARCYGLDWWSDHSKIQQLMAMVGGHPYLLSLAFYHLHRSEMTLAELLLAAPTPAGIYSSYLRRLLAMLLGEVQLLSAMQRVVTAQQSVGIERINHHGAAVCAVTAYQLENLGLVQLDGHHVKPTCDLYRLYFRSQLPALTAQPTMAA